MMQVKFVSDLPDLTESEYTSVKDFQKYYPIEYNRNMTAFLISEVDRYVREKRVFEASFMGERRSGKSEGGSWLCMVYVKIFNYYFNHPELFDKGCSLQDMDVKSEGVKVRPIVFNTDYVHDNQHVYKERIKEMMKNKELTFGQIHQVDEKEDNLGGLGSFTDYMEDNNISNITAKFCQSKVYCKPDELQAKNCPYGIKIIKKDEVKRINWGILFKIEATVNGASEFKFMGWVKIPMHKDEAFRKKYNLLKNKWIAKEYTGGDYLVQQRYEIAKEFVNQFPQYFEFNEKNKPKYPFAKLDSIFKLLLVEGKLKVNKKLNNAEYIDVINQAMMIAELKAGIKR